MLPRPNLDRVSPGPLRVPVPSALVGTVIALCAVLLLKWLAVVALVAGGLLVLARWLWRRRYRTLALGLDPAPARPPEQGLVRLPGPPPPDPDCTWCGLTGGHHDAYGRPLRPRHVHGVPARRQDHEHSGQAVSLSPLRGVPVEVGRVAMAATPSGARCPT